MPNARATRSVIKWRQRPAIIGIRIAGTNRLCQEKAAFFLALLSVPG